MMVSSNGTEVFMLARNCFSNVSSSPEIGSFSDDTVIPINNKAKVQHLCGLDSNAINFVP